MSNNNGNVDVSYNVQTTVDSKHKMIVDFKVIQNPNDLGQLAEMSLRAKNILGVDKIETLADKGYYKIDDLVTCLENGITPFVAKQVHTSGTGIKEFNPDKFIYNKNEDIYLCPFGKRLYRWRTRKTKGQLIGHDYKNFKACNLCPLKARCTKSPRGRTVFRHIHQNSLDSLNVKLEDNRTKYKLRQMIVEHPFGTIKRSWGAYYFLTRKKVSVTAEVALSYLAYNFKRALNVIGVKKMIEMLHKRDMAFS